MIDHLFTWLVQDFGYEDLDDFFDCYPYISKPTKHMLFCVKCSECSYQESEEYQRQHPDCLRLRQWCPECHADLILVQAIPSTIFYWSHSFKHASFCDEVQGECWQCGRKKGTLHPYTFSNGQLVELCRKHLVRYHKDMWRMNEQRARFLAAEPCDDDPLTDSTLLKSFDVPGDDDPFDALYELP